MSLMTTICFERQCSRLSGLSGRSHYINRRQF